MMNPQPQKEHQWLSKLVGAWTYETEAMGEPDKPSEKFQGSETVRSLGGLWFLGEGQGQMPGGGSANTLLTLGYDPQRQTFVGTWIGSMMTHLWVYTEGTLDATGHVLTMNAEGPSFSGEAGKTAKYRDVFELKTDDHRVLTAHVQGDNGEWTQLMTTHYRRQK
jgi:hypothetical protein